MVFPSVGLNIFRRRRLGGASILSDVTDLISQSVSSSRSGSRVSIDGETILSTTKIPTDPQDFNGNGSPNTTITDLGDGVYRVVMPVGPGSFMRHDMSGLSSGQTVTLTFDARDRSGSTVSINYRLTNTSGGNASFNVTDPITTEWQTYTVTATVAANDSQSLFIRDNGTNNADIEIRQPRLSVTPVQIPAFPDKVPAEYAQPDIVGASLNVLTVMPGDTNQVPSDLSDWSDPNNRFTQTLNADGSWRITYDASGVGVLSASVSSSSAVRTLRMQAKLVSGDSSPSGGGVYVALRESGNFTTVQSVNFLRLSDEWLDIEIKGEDGVTVNQVVFRGENNAWTIDVRNVMLVDGDSSSLSRPHYASAGSSYGEDIVSVTPAYPSEGSIFFAALDYDWNGQSHPTSLNSYYIDSIAASVFGPGNIEFNGNGGSPSFDSDVTQLTGSPVFGVVDWDGTDVGFQVDGFDRVTAAQAGTPSGAITIGNRAAGGRSIKGSIVMGIIDRVLTAAEVAQLRSICISSLSSAIGLPTNRLPAVDVVAKTANMGAISYGQSQSVGSMAQPAISTTQPYSNTSWSTGPRGAGNVITTISSLVEDDLAAPDGQSNRGETFSSGLANYATELAVAMGELESAHPIFSSSPGRGGSRIDQLDAASAWWGTNFIPHITAANGLLSGFSVPVVSWVQGGSDGSQGTTRLAYKRQLIQLIEDINVEVKAITGQTTPVHVVVYQSGSNNIANDGPARAQLEVAQEHPLCHFSTATYFIPAVDGIHFINTENRRIARYIGRAYHQLVNVREVPKYLNPISAKYKNRVVTIYFDVPTLPLVIDNTLMPYTTTDDGFAVEDGSGVMTITGISVVGSTVEITVDADATGSVEVRYGFDYLAGGWSINNGATGNLRDSTPDNKDGFQLFHAAPAFVLNAPDVG